MFAALLVSVFLTKVRGDEHEFSLLGRAIYLPRYSVLGEQTETGTQVRIYNDEFCYLGALVIRFPQVFIRLFKNLLLSCSER